MKVTIQFTEREEKVLRNLAEDNRNLKGIYKEVHKYGTEEYDADHRTVTYRFHENCIIDLVKLIYDAVGFLDVFIRKCNLFDAEWSDNKKRKVDHTEDNPNNLLSPAAKDKRG